MEADAVYPEIRTDFRLLDKSAAIATPTRQRDFHDLTPQGGDGAVLVIRDSGIDAEHPVFDDVRVEQPSIDGLPTNGRDDVGHGTFVASIARFQVAQVEKIVSVPIFGQSGRTDLSTIDRSYDYIINRFGNISADVYVNDSWGARSKIPQIDQRHNEMEQAGIDSITAAGNTDQNTGSPATATRCYAVAGCRLDGTMTRFSSPTDDLAALALNVVGAKSQHANMGEPVPEDHYDDVMKEYGGDYNYGPGTSFAAPIVAGAGINYTTTQVQAARPPDQTRAFEQAFNETATPITGSEEDGNGYLDFAAAVEEGTTEPAVPKPRGRATTWDFAGGAGIWHNKDWFEGNYTTTLIEKDDDGRRLVEFSPDDTGAVRQELLEVLSENALESLTSTPADETP